ncbi:hypothetical protein [Paenibacillus sp. MBLB4367]|uniref:hypothetical protein n=1 Tax=Paenibacillus sp. MBLB4367 TaxID=3384767 RepID=UPI0039082CBC
MGRFIKLVALAMVADVFLSALIGIGVYAGFSVYPFAAPVGQSADSFSFHMTIPLWMPSIQDVKTPLTFLQASSGANMVWTVIGSLLAAVVLSFIRGMYLGGMNGLLHNKSVSLWSCGCYYFNRMLGWTLIYALITGIAMLAAAALGPLGFLLLLLLFFYSLTPYIIVLLDIGLGEAISRSPGIFRLYFTRLLGLALLAAVLTLCVSFMNTAAEPYRYFFVMLFYSAVGSALIRELMSRLAMLLKKDRAALPPTPVPVAKESRLGMTGGYMLLPVLPLLGIAFASGYHLQALDWGVKQSRTGISFGNGFSDAFYASDQQYTSYIWDQQSYRLEISLPDLSDGDGPDEIRGFGQIRWNVDQDVITRLGQNSTQHRIVPTLVKDTFYYRLKREQSDDGSFYYSSRHGVVGTLPSGRKQREPLSVVMTVSGDGSSVFLLQHPARFEPWQVYRVSPDGSFLIPKTNQVNPNDFHYYWFANNLQKEEMFRFLQDKNAQNGFFKKERLYVLLAAALQEADGEMVKRLLDAMRGGEATVNAPSWDAQQWTAQLRDRYAGTDVQGMLPYITKAGEQGGHEAERLSAQDGNEQFRIRVAFPDGAAAITYTESNHLLKQLSVEMEGRH